VRLVPARAHTHDLVALRAAADERTRLIFIANPNNPTGTWNRQAEVDRLVETLPAGVLLVLDEAYYEYAHDPEARGEADCPDGLGYVRRGARVVVLRTFSKAHGLAGLRVGYAVAAANVIVALDTIREPFNSNSLGQAAALAAIEDSDHIERSLALNRTERGQLAAALGQRGLSVLPSLANFVCVDTGRNARALFQELLRRGVIVRPLGAYGLDSWLRVSVGRPEENVAFLDALDDALAGPSQ
jgi:histidinol-phosphate aminotransferase